MQPHQKRVVDEKRELDERLEKLLNFIEASNVFGTLPEAEQSRLRIQYSVMQCYGTILGERIAHFPSA